MVKVRRYRSLPALFAIDAKTLAKIEPVVRRTLVIDPNPHAARLLADVMKALGAREVAVEPDTKRALLTARDLEPGLIFTERGGEGLDGEDLTRKVRRSSMQCRRAPIIMVTADATASSIKGARDSGVHEFLRKPYTSNDLFKRIENVALKPRDWIEAVGYVGPDRRRFNAGEYAGPAKRRSDKAAGAAGEAGSIKDQAMRIVNSAMAQFDTDPAQAVRAIRQQAETLKGLAVKTGDTQLAIASAGLEACFGGSAPDKAALAGPVASLLKLADPESLMSRSA